MHVSYKQVRNESEKIDAGLTAFDPETGLRCGHPQRAADSLSQTTSPSPTFGPKNREAQRNLRMSTALEKKIKSKSLENIDD